MLDTTTPTPGSHQNCWPVQVCHCQSSSDIHTAADLINSSGGGGGGTESGSTLRMATAFLQCQQKTDVKENGGETWKRKHFWPYAAPPLTSTSTIAEKTLRREKPLPSQSCDSSVFFHAACWGFSAVKVCWLSSLVRLTAAHFPPPPRRPVPLCWFHTAAPKHTWAPVTPGTRCSDALQWAVNASEGSASRGERMGLHAQRMEARSHGVADCVLNRWGFVGLCQGTSHEHLCFPITAVESSWDETKALRKPLQCEANTE